MDSNGSGTLVIDDDLGHDGLAVLIDEGRQAGTTAPNHKQIVHTCHGVHDDHGLVADAFHFLVTPNKSLGFLCHILLG